MLSEAEYSAIRWMLYMHIRQVVSSTSLSPWSSQSADLAVRKIILKTFQFGDTQNKVSNPAVVNNSYSGVLDYFLFCEREWHNTSFSENYITDLLICLEKNKKSRVVLEI